MEQFIPIIGSLILPMISQNIFIIKDPPEIIDKLLLPLLIYSLAFILIGMITYYINMKRQCNQIIYTRILKKTLSYVSLVIILFGIINYFRWPTISWIQSNPTNSELFVTGIILMICSMISYYIIRILTSNC